LGVDKLQPELEIDLHSNSQKILKLITSSKESWIRWVFHSMGVMCGAVIPAGGLIQKMPKI
jgi:hypothetical protein